MPLYIEHSSFKLNNFTSKKLNDVYEFHFQA